MIRKKMDFNKDSNEVFVLIRRWAAYLRNIIPKSFRHKFPSLGIFIRKSNSFPIDDQYPIMRDGVKFIINRSDYVQWRLYYGVRDNALAQTKTRLKENSIVLDVGASIGAYSLRLAHFINQRNLRNAQVFAFEPNKLVFDSLRGNLELNPQLKSFAAINNFGLGCVPSEKKFEVRQSNSGAGRISESGSLKINVKRLDDLIEELNPVSISFINLCAEGFEPEVLKGGWRTIQKFKPPIFLEVTRNWWSEHNANVEDVLKDLEGVGYSFQVELHNELFPFDEKRDLIRSQFNLFAIPLA